MTEAEYLWASQATDDDIRALAKELNRPFDEVKEAHGIILRLCREQYESNVQKRPDNPQYQPGNRP